MRSTIARSESKEKRDARIARLINSIRGPRTAAEIAECDEWLAERTAVVREAHQRYPMQTYSEAEEGDEIVEKRLEYVRARLGTESWWKGRTATADERKQIVAMRNGGQSYAEIARRLDLKPDAVRRWYSRDNQSTRATA